MRNSGDLRGFSASSADPKEDWPDEHPDNGGPVGPGAPVHDGEAEADYLTDQKQDEEMRARFGGGNAHAEPAAEDCRQGVDGGAGPEEEGWRNLAANILRGKEMGQDGIAASDDAIDHDVTEHNRRDGSEQLQWECLLHCNVSFGIGEGRRIARLEYG